MAHPRSTAAARRRPAQSMVEFALIVPILVVIIVGIIELGILFSVYVGLTNSAREAARAGAVYEFPGDAPTNAQAETVVPTIDAQRQAYMGTVISSTLNPIIQTTSLTVTTPVYIPARATAADRALNPLRSGDTVSVTLQYTHRMLWGLLGTRDIVVSASSAARIEPGGGN